MDVGSAAALSIGLLSRLEGYFACMSMYAYACIDLASSQDVEGTIFLREVTIYKYK